MMRFVLLFLLVGCAVQEPLQFVTPEPRVVEPVVLDESNPIYVGVVHSLSGTMAISEAPLVDALLLAIDEVNEQGGLLGRPIKPIVVDGKSDPDVFAREVERLIVEFNVSSIFGGWTSASRKAMKPVVERYNNLLWYSVQYEGTEISPNIIYLGATPNQQLLPAVDWAFKNFGSRFFLVGSDYVFPRTANEVMKLHIAQLGGSVVGEEYKVLGVQDFGDVVEKIVESSPDVILNTVNGDSNVGLFRDLHRTGISPSVLPMISFSVSEHELGSFNGDYREGDFAAWTYLESLPYGENQLFVKKFKLKYGVSRVVSDPMAASYSAMLLFAAAVKSAGSSVAVDIRDAARGLVVMTPQGPVGIHPSSHHSAKVTRIGRLTKEGDFSLVWSSEVPVMAEPFVYKSVDEWNIFLNDLYSGYGGRWSK